MKSIATLVLLVAAASAAVAGTPCDEVKAMIAAKLDAKGVTNYSLDVVDSDKVGDGKVVGSCEGGTKKIVYTRK